MEAADIKAIVNKVIGRFPLIQGAKIEPEAKLSDIVNLFSSLLSERVKVRLLDEFPNALFENLSPSTTIEEIYNSIIESNNEDISNTSSTIDFDSIINLQKENNIPKEKSNSSKNKSSIGIDIESKDSFPEDIFSLSSTALRSNLFTEYEVAYSISKPDPELTLLGIYSAKESIIKAIYLFDSISYKDIEIRHTNSGKPFAKVKGFQHNSLKISISHSNDLAISSCIFDPE